MRGVVFLAAVLGIVDCAYAQSAGGYYKNERWGYKVRVPSDFKNAALSASETWIASKHIQTRPLYSKKSQFLEEDYPQMWVIGFLKARQRERGAKVKKKDDGTAEVTFNNPYKDYKDFVKRESWFVGGGYYFSKEEKDEIHGTPVTKYEIKVTKMVNAPYRIVTWVYHYDDGDFAVQCKVLEDYWKKYEPTFLACLRSFKRIPRTGAMPGAATTGAKIIDTEDESKLTPKERAKRRKEIFEKTLHRETDALPKEWFVVRSEYHVVMSNGSRRYAKEVLEHADAVHDYLEKTFGSVGTDYVPPGIIRIFATSAELQAYTTTTSSNWWDWSEQVTGSEQDAAERKSWALESISTGVTHQYLWNRNRMLYDNMPAWFRFGLESYVAFLRSKGRRVEVKPDEYDRETMRQLVRSGKTVPIKTLFETGDMSQFQYAQESGYVLAFLLTKGNHGKWRNCVRDYMTNLVGAVEAAEKEFKAFEKKQEAEQKNEGAAAPVKETEKETGKDDDPQSKYWERYKAAVKKKNKEIREQAFQKTFGELTDRDWDRLDKAWRDWAN